jgi:hypothetical protein
MRLPGHARRSVGSPDGRPSHRTQPYVRYANNTPMPGDIERCE